MENRTRRSVPIQRAEKMSNTTVHITDLTWSIHVDDASKLQFK